jgi:hypothetical protein
VRRRLLFGREESSMKAIIERCAGIDVGKKFITLCILIGAPSIFSRIDVHPVSEVVTIKRVFEKVPAVVRSGAKRLGKLER